jgi:hypothetical protein
MGSMEEAHRRDYETQRLCREARQALAKVKDAPRCHHLASVIVDLTAKLERIEEGVVLTWN